MDNALALRDGSTLGIMDDLQIAIHSYDGCHKGCSGCLVDKHFKNHARFEPIVSSEQQLVIHDRVLSYYQWIQDNLNTKDIGYFNCNNGFKVNHFSYTFRFGNHSELSVEDISGMSSRMNAPYKVFSTAPDSNIEKFIEVSNKDSGRIFLEIIYDPVVDDPEVIKAMILNMRSNGILGYPEILITKRLLDVYPNSELFVDKCLYPFGDIGGVQVQFGRYTPSRTRSFSKTQMVSLDKEVEWLTGVAKRIVEKNIDIHPIPLGEYAVTLLDEFSEIDIWDKESGINIENRHVTESLQDNFNPLDKEFLEKIRDIYITSLYIDHKLDVFLWSESMGQHVLNDDLGFKPLGNIKGNSIQDIVKRGGIVDKIVRDTAIDLVKNKRCSSCSYKGFCSTHAISLFRKWEKDDGKYCYGYLPVIREFQKDIQFLNRMIDGFKEIEF